MAIWILILPVEARSPKFGVCTFGLCHETSFQPENIQDEWNIYQSNLTRTPWWNQPIDKISSPSRWNFLWTFQLLLIELTISQTQHKPDESPVRSVFPKDEDIFLKIRTGWREKHSFRGLRFGRILQLHLNRSTNINSQQL